MTLFPEGKRFAFTVFDDTDHASVANVEPVYRLLAELGLRTTKSVWPLPSDPTAPIGGSSLADADYLGFIRWLQGEGFEIGLHNVRNVDSPRQVTKRGLDVFRDLIGHDPRTFCQHVSNRENLYWGVERLSNPAVRLGYNLSTRFRRTLISSGHDPDSAFFWGDLCRDRIDYVRNFVFDEINLLRVNPTLPYHDPRRPYVKFWFSSCEGGTVTTFNRMLHEANQDRLEAEGGICIMYTHFANGFVQDGRVDPLFRRQLERLAGKNGWFVPVATLLDHVRSRAASRVIPRTELRAMEMRWFANKLRKGTS